MKNNPVQSLELSATECPICHTTDNAVELYPAKLSEDAFNAETFSARRLPDRVHYRIVRCASCGLVRSDPVADPRIQAELYAKAGFDYGEQVGNLRETYGRYLAKLEALGARKGSILEIGGGNGFVLQEAVAQGYTEVTGVEPSSAAIASADPAIRAHMICDLMRPGLFEAEQFDVVCMFQTFDHITDPNALLDECFRVLKPGGRFLFLTPNLWDYGSLLAKFIPSRLHPRLVASLEGRKEEDTFPTYFRSNTLRAVRKLARQSGFLVEHHEYLGQYPNYLLFSRLFFYLGMAYEKTITKMIPPLRGWLAVSLLRN